MNQPFSLASLLAFCIALPPQPAAPAAPLPTQGDTHVPGHATSPLSPNDVNTIQAAVQHLNQIDPTAAQDIAAAANAGELGFANCDTPGFVGCADGNTIAVRMGDSVDIPTVAARIQHEYHHWKHGNNGHLGPCEHMAVFAITYNTQAAHSCEPGSKITCNMMQNLHDQVTNYWLECDDLNGGNGDTPFPDLAPGACCN
ncbi:MAG: hypothetical protein KAI24_24230 [Planctomycetes bacterium]|nr:hypothetical protein [Planctomycetota bacterium]